MKQTELLNVDPHCAGRLDRGEVVIESSPEPGSATPRVTAWGVVEAPPAAVWALIDGVSDYQRVLPGVKRSQELSRDGSQVQARVTVGLPFPLKDLSATTAGEHLDLGDGVYLRSWSLVEGDYHKNSGCWVMGPFRANPRRTLLVYQLHVEPKTKIPNKIQDMAQKKALPRMFDQLRKLAR